MPSWTSRSFHARGRQGKESGSSVFGSARSHVASESPAPHSRDAPAARDTCAGHVQLEGKFNWSKLIGGDGWCGSVQFCHGSRGQGRGEPKCSGHYCPCPGPQLEYQFLGKNHNNAVYFIVPDRWALYRDNFTGCSCSTINSIYILYPKYMNIVNSRVSSAQVHF